MARVDYDRMAPDYVEGRVLPPEGMEPWRLAIRPWLPAEGARRSPVLDLGAGTGQFAAGLSTLDQAVDAETVPAPVVDRIDLLVLRRRG